MSALPELHTSTPSAAVHVRAATRNDYAAIRGVVIAAYQQYEPIIGAVLFERYLADVTDLDQHASRGQLLVAEIDGVVSGSVAFYPDTSVQGVGWPPGWAGGRALAVHPEARRHGIAQALLAACEQLARESGACVFAFHTASFMPAAVALYAQRYRQPRVNPRRVVIRLAPDRVMGSAGLLDDR
jgi:predicted N-acetyltransferase YhbS